MQGPTHRGLYGTSRIPAGLALSPAFLRKNNHGVERIMGCKIPASAPAQKPLILSQEKVIQMDQPWEALGREWPYSPHPCITSHLAQDGEEPSLSRAHAELMGTWRLGRCGGRNFSSGSPNHLNTFWSFGNPRSLTHTCGGWAAGGWTLLRQTRTHSVICFVKNLKILGPDSQLLTTGAGPYCLRLDPARRLLSLDMLNEMWAERHNKQS